MLLRFSCLSIIFVFTLCFFFFFKQKTAYEIKECDWSSDVCSSDLRRSGNSSVHVQLGDGAQYAAAASATVTDEIDLLLNVVTQVYQPRLFGAFQSFDHLLSGNLPCEAAVDEIGRAHV